MPLLADCELEAMQAEVISFYDHMLDIYRPAAATTDDYGGHDEGAMSSTPVHTDIPCEISSGVAHTVDVENMGQMVSTQEYTISVPLGTDVRKNDEVVITSADDLRLRVTVVFLPESQATEIRFIADEEILGG